MTRKVCVVITARPSYSRIKSALQAVDDHEHLALQLVVCASAVLERYGSAIAQIEHDGFRIDRKIISVLEGENLISMAKTTGLGLIEMASALDDLSPDVVVTVADRYETMATAVASAYLNLPLCHIQGGEVTGSIDEKVRHAVTKLADLHLVSTEKAAERVIRMGEDPAAVHVTGCPSIDLAAEVLNDPRLDFDPIALYGGVGSAVDISDGYIVVMQHPVTTEHDEARRQVLETLHAVRGVGLPVLWFWPNSDAGADGTSNGIRSFREQEEPDNFHFFKSMAPTDFLKLLYNSSALVGNSSVGIRECSFLGVPVVNVGTRQSGRERGANVVDVPYGQGAIESALRAQIGRERPPSDTLYGDAKAGQRIAHVLAQSDLRFEKKLTY